MTPMESKLVKCLVDAEAFIAEGRIHHAHLVIQQSIAESGAVLAAPAGLVLPESPIGAA